MKLKTLTTAAGWIALSLLPASGQVQVAAPEFDVASVKPADPPDPDPLAFIPASVAAKMGFEGGPGTNDPGRIRYLGLSLQTLLARAWNMNPDQISGPPWLGSERYTIEAILPQGTDAEQLRLMLQTLLIERFRISLHREVRQTRVYRLKVAKNGPRLMPPGTEPLYQNDDERKEALRSQAMDSLEKMKADLKAGRPLNNRGWGLPRATMKRFTEMLSGNLDRPVLDMTRLEGEYRFRLEWSTEAALQNDSAGVSIFTAVQDQLGLNLEAGNEPIEFLVIDKAEKMPTAPVF